jgi:hypothetical protein
MHSISSFLRNLASQIGLHRIGFGLLTLIALGLILWFPSRGPIVPASNTGEVLAQSTVPTQTPTLDPVSEILANRSQTNGIILGASILMIIILFATLGSFRRHPPASSHDNVPPQEP